MKEFQLHKKAHPRQLATVLRDKLRLRDCRAAGSHQIVDDQHHVVLVEGIHVFYDAAVRDLMDFKIYIQVDPDVCLLRRVKRDLRDRGRTIEGVYQQYLETVKPMYEKHIRNYVEYADLIVARGGKNARIVDILAHYINSGMIEEVPRS